MGPGGLRVDAIHRVVPDLALDAAVAAAAAGVPADGSARSTGTARRRSSPRSHRWLADAERAGLPAHRRPPARAAHRARRPSSARGACRGAAGLARSRRRARPSRPARPAAGIAATTRSRCSSPTASRRRSGPRPNARGVALLLRAPSPADVAAVARAGRADAAEVDAVRAEAAHRTGPAAARGLSRSRDRRHALPLGRRRRPSAGPCDPGGSSPRRPTPCRCRCARTGAAARPRPRRRHPAARAPPAAAATGRR